MSAYRKSLMALAGAVVVTIAAATTDDVVTTAELVQVVLAGVGAFAVYLVPNAPGFATAKTLTSAAMAGLGLVGGWLATGHHITNAMWWNVALAVGTALGIFILPNDQEPAVPPTASTPAS